MFFKNLSRLVSLAGYDLEVMCNTKELPLVRSVSPASVVFVDSQKFMPALVDQLLRVPKKAIIHNNLLGHRHALQKHLSSLNVEIKIWERSPLADFQWIEDDIFFGESRLFDFSAESGPAHDQPSGLGEKMLEALTNDIDGSRNFEVTNARRQKRNPVVVEPEKDFILFLLDNTRVTGWGNPTGPGATLYPHFPSPVEALHIFSAFASSRGFEFVVKTHPSDSSKFASDFSGSQGADAPLSQLLPRASGVVTGISKTAWSAAAWGKPFATLGVNPIQGLTGLRHEMQNASLLLDRFATDLDGGGSVERQVLARGLHFASDSVWVKSDATNRAWEELADWVTSGSKDNSHLPGFDADSWPEFTPSDRLVADESAAVFELLKFHQDQLAQPSDSLELVAIDVGAHSGEVTMKARSLGYRVFAFEPNPKVASKFVRLHAGDPKVFLSRAALSSGPEEIRSFFTSDISTISTLTPFHRSHVEQNRVFTSTLRTFLSQWEIDSVDVLKVDTEGYDLFVLQGYDWSKHKPRAIVCEFEDAKTRALGYSANDLASFLVEKGYFVFVSEWFPIVRYGGEHAWKGVYPFGERPVPESSWGNFIAVLEQVNHRDLFLHLATFVRHRPILDKRGKIASTAPYARLKSWLRKKSPKVYDLARSVTAVVRLAFGSRPAR